jgi:hypothetical protein
MQYLIYIAVATPLVLGWLLWETAGAPRPSPMFHSFADDAHDTAVLKQHAENELRQRQVADAAQRQAEVTQIASEPPLQPPRRAPSYEQTARASPGPDSLRKRHD